MEPWCRAVMKVDRVAKWFGRESKQSRKHEHEQEQEQEWRHVWLYNLMDERVSESLSGCSSECVVLPAKMPRCQDAKMSRCQDARCRTPTRRRSPSLVTARTRTRTRTCSRSRARRGEKSNRSKNCRDPGSNQGPSDLQSDALPTELSRRRTYTNPHSYTNSNTNHTHTL